MSASILVVDDDPQVLDVFERSLSMAGYAVSTAETGRLAMASIQATEFDLILLDIVMPDMDGLEFLRNLLKQKSKLKIVAMSGMFHGQFLNAAKQLGAKAILPKPISTERLLKVVNETLTEGTAATQDHGEYSVLKLGALDVYLGKSRVRFDPAFTIETENVLSIREDLIWVPVAHDSDGCLMQSDMPQFHFKLLWTEVETITVLETNASLADMCWKLRATPIYDGHQVRMAGAGYCRISA